ncbi:MAG: hypothetical protein IIB95_11950 [Candidatus Marinimicrobia bacterium]|nr:hypothetical protein [Candidatus Neomarinimicrobiota bacterium]
MWINIEDSLSKHLINLDNVKKIIIQSGQKNQIEIQYIDGKSEVVHNDNIVNEVWRQIQKDI